MKVFVALFLVISSVAARGSGPYLPSGWRPDGPAFNLPSEAKPVPRIVQESLIEETEASGSDALREYGPPKLDVIINANQGLPDVASEQTPSQANKSDEVVTDVQEIVNIEGNTEQVAAIIEETSIVTESNGAEAVKPEEEAAPLTDVQTTADSPAKDVSADIAQTKEVNEPEQSDVPAVILEDSVIATAVAEEVVVPLYKQELQQDAVPTVGLEIVANQNPALEILTPSSEVVASLNEVEEGLTQDAISTPVEEVNNISEAIVSLEKEAKALEIQDNENAAILGTSQQTPEGLLEYSPPGFLEYGPPKQELLVLAAEVTDTNPDNNEVRRRRYSPKFRSLKKH